MEDIVPMIMRGRLKKPLLESEIRNVQQIAKSAAEAARLLEVSYNTYKKYAKLYGIFEDLKNPHGYGIFKGSSASSFTKPLDEIIEGKHPTYPVWKLKRRLLLSGYMEEKCSCCGFSEKRLTDHRVPLILDFIDDDRTNHKYENLQMLCFNCAFLTRGNLSGPKKEFIY
jgi:hypothetical protein